MGFTGTGRLLFWLVAISLLLHNSPAVAQCTFSGLDGNYSTSDEPAALSGSRAGGVFVGPGISGTHFDPAAAGPGVHTITYVDTSVYDISRSGNFAPISFNSGTSDSGWTRVPAAVGGNLDDIDDGLSSPINIGFTFNFFGFNYTQLFVSSNGDVTFTPYDASTWNATRIPRPEAPNNMIALARLDLKVDSPINSEIKYRLDGVAPNRVLILNIEYTDPRSRNANGAGSVPNVITQLKLFEATHAIEIHTTDLSAHDADWDDWWEARDDDDDDEDEGDDDRDNDDDDHRDDDEDPDDRDRVRSLQGIENHDGTRAYYLRGRNNQRWRAFQDVVAFTGCTESRTVTVSGGFTIGGTLAGLGEDNHLTLRLNGAEDLILDTNGAFVFASVLEDDSAYELAIITQPENQNCTVANGNGLLNGSAITDISISCSGNTYSVTYGAGPNGSISGISSQTVAAGGDASEVTAVADPGYLFGAWSDGSTSNPRSDSNISGNINVVAAFVATDTPPPAPGTDVAPPVFTPAAAISIEATGLLTSMSSLVPPEVVDDVDGAVSATLAIEQNALRPGAHLTHWAAEDAAGNRSEINQRLNIHPIISLSMNQEQPEGGRADIRFLLNGPTPSYPLTVGYEVTGTADNSDHDLRSGTVTFTEGELEQVLTANITDDGAADALETIVVTLVAATTSEGAANFGSQRTHTITIVEHNLAPVAEIQFQQNGRRARIIDRNGGPVTVQAIIRDPNPEDTHTSDWLFPLNATVNDVDATTKLLDPASLAAGLHHVEISVYEQNSTPLVSQGRKSFLLIQDAPALHDDTDSDGDGLGDAAEGYADKGGDGQPDFRDPLGLSNVVSEQAADSYLYQVEADPGVRLELGDYALQGGADGTRVTEEQLNESIIPSLTVDTIESNDTYVDFQIRRLPMGGTVRVVIPQRQPLPAGAVYRKYSSGVWTVLEETGEDGAASTGGEEGICPPPGSADYRPGLAVGDWCVQLSLTDGGPNDADGEANGIIKDPGGISVGSDSNGSGDFTTGGGGATGSLALVLLGLLAIVVRADTWRRINSRCFGIAILAACCLGRPAPAEAGELITAYDPVYFLVDAGYASTTIDNAEMDARFAAAGQVADTLAVEGDRVAWSAGVGYRATDRFSFEVSYLDLGDVELEFQTESVGSEVASIHPESGHGAAISLIYRHPVTQRFGASARAGLFIWEGDFATYQNETWISESRGRNNNAIYGLGIDYIISPEWSIDAQIQRFDFDLDPTHAVFIGIQFRLLEWFNKDY